jgi:SAM-dependent methyltransferase
MQSSEFDKFADEYLATHKSNVAITGEDPEYFARYKIAELARLYAARGYDAPKAILDFGCGIGASIPHLRTYFPNAKISGLDVSARSLDIARKRFPGVADFHLLEGDRTGVADGSFDLIFSSCVFHHIRRAEHVPILARLKALLAPTGRLAIFEHNPLNPVTRYIVATCPFDENAVLIPSGSFAAAQRKAGFRRVQVAYTGFFPGSLRALRRFEPWLRGVPLGAQYYTVATP